MIILDKSWIQSTGKGGEEGGSVIKPSDHEHATADPGDLDRGQLKGCDNILVGIKVTSG